MAAAGSVQTRTLDILKNNSRCSLTTFNSALSYNDLVVEPVDVEESLIIQKKNILQCDKDGRLSRFFCEFPDDDLGHQCVSRIFRTDPSIMVDLAKNETTTVQARDCINAVSCKFDVSIRSGNRYKQHCLQRPQLLSKILPQQYEIDIAQQRGDADSTHVAHLSSQRSSVISISSDSTGASVSTDSCTTSSHANTVDFDQFTGDLLINGLIARTETQLCEAKNRELRQHNRTDHLFLLYPLQHEEDIVERRDLPAVPSASLGHRFLVNILQMKMESDVEPVFASMALYDAKERKKVSENFYFDCNSEDTKVLLKAHIPFQDVSTLSRSALFTVTQPSPDLFLVIKLEKVLQPGGSESTDGLLKDDKKSKYHAAEWCKRLGAFRMPFAWTAVSLFDVVTGLNATTDACSQDLEKPFASNEDKEDVLGTWDRRSQISSSCRLPRNASFGGVRTSYTDSANLRLNRMMQNIDCFKPITLTINNFFKQDSERLQEEEFYKLLVDVRRPAVLSKKLKSVTGILKMDISPCPADVGNCLSPELWRIIPFTNVEARPTKEILEFPLKEVFVPNVTFRNLLFVYPKCVNFASRPGSARNITVKIQLLSSEDKSCALPVIFGKSCCPEFCAESFTSVSYHNKSPHFFDEIKMNLPIDLNEKHHLFFTFYHLSCKAKWLPLMQNGSLAVGDFGLPVSLEPLPASYSYLSPHVNLPNIKWLDNHKPAFMVRIAAASVIHTQDNFLDSFLKLYYDIASQSLSSKLCEPSILEQELRRCILDIPKAKPEPLVRFLYLIFDKLLDLLVNPPFVSGSSVSVGKSCFETMLTLVKILTFLFDSCCDHHGRSNLLTVYVHYTCQINYSLRDHQDASSSHNELLEVIKGFERSWLKKSTTLSCCKSGLAHEQLAIHWLSSVGLVREMAIMHCWFFLEIIVKAMSVYLTSSSRLFLPRRLRFSNEFVENITQIAVTLFAELIGRCPKDFRTAQNINVSVGFFISDLFSLMDRSFVTGLVKLYCKHMVMAKAVYSNDVVHLILLKLDFLRIISAHEHFLVLNLPLLQYNGHNEELLQNLPIYAGPNCTISIPAPPQATPAQRADVRNGSSSPTPSVASKSSASSVGGQLSSRSSICTGSGSIGCAELTLGFRSRHFLVGLILSDLSICLDSPNKLLHKKSINIIRNLLTMHDFESRFPSNDKAIKALVAQLYFPLLGFALDNISRLFDPHAKLRTPSFRNSFAAASSMNKFEATDAPVSPAIAMAIAVGSVPTVYRSAATNESACDSFAADHGDPMDGNETDAKRPILTLESTRTFLVCFCWVLKNLDRQQLRHWLTDLANTRLVQLLDVLQLCVSCFEYKSPARASCSASGLTDDQRAYPTCRSGSLRLRTKLEEVLIGGQNLRTEFRKLSHHSAGVVKVDPSLCSEVANASSAEVISASSCQSPNTIRWRKDQIQFRQGHEHFETIKPELENDSATEGNLAKEVMFVVLDVINIIMSTMPSSDGAEGTRSGIVHHIVRVILHTMACNQSVQTLQCVFDTQRLLVAKHSHVVLEQFAEQCAELCMHLLRHCSSLISEVRSNAAASLYLLMRQAYESGGSLARVKMQITVSLSALVGTGACFNEDCLRRSLKTILTYAEVDLRSIHMPVDASFVNQVKDLLRNLHTILSDTLKMKKFEHDFEMQQDLMYRIAKGYQNSPDLRLTWLHSIAAKHIEHQNMTEAAMCMVHAAALVAEYLQMIEDVPYRPVGCVTFLPISDNILEESAVSDDVISPDEDGICESRFFTEAGLCQLLEQAAHYFYVSQMFESTNQVYKLLIPIFEEHRMYRKIAEVYAKLSEALAKCAEPGSTNNADKRLFGTFFRVGFYGAKFGDLSGSEFIYKEPPITKLPEISHRLEGFYANLFGPESVEIIKDSNTVDLHALNPLRAYLQVTYVEPYFDRWELRRRPTHFEQSNSVRRFMYATPFTLDGKAHGDLAEQCKRKTVLTTSHSFPYVKTRIQVIAREQFVLTPIEVAIEDLQKKTKELWLATSQVPPDAKMLQMVLQGCIGTTVNQGPMEVANVFLSNSPKQVSCPQFEKFQNKLRICFKDFAKKCADALKENKRLIGSDQKEYQRELERNYVSFTEKLAPMISSVPLFVDSMRRHSRRKGDSEHLINLS